jgi:hypothetical protein
MTYALIGLFVLILTGIVAFIFYKMFRKYRKAYEVEHNKLIGLEAEYTRLVEAYQIRKNNKEEADEKIDDLHSGVISADDILPKR